MPYTGAMRDATTPIADYDSPGVRARTGRQAIGATDRIRRQQNEREVRRKVSGNLGLAGAGQARDRDQERLAACRRRTCEAGEHR
jgi:hypothetical protein